jgi:ATP-dependent Lhr-like helicase
VSERLGAPAGATEWAAATARQLLTRYGIVTRETAAAESVPGGFAGVYDVLKAMEESGRVRRGLFVGGLTAAQFATPAALDLLRAMRDEPDAPQVVHLAATDPANPYGATLRWPSSAPEGAREGRALTRSAGALVVLVNGRLGAYLPRGDRRLSAFLPESDPERSIVARAVAVRLFELATDAEGPRRGVLVSEVDGAPVAEHPLAPYLLQAGFVRGAMGFQAVRDVRRPAGADAAPSERPLEEPVEY